jgi:ABC-type bacteriocin/lantibiotic exporter with double-glycine peptidase domain
MVLAHHGILLEEAELRACCQTTFSGTAFPNASACVRRYGLFTREIVQASWQDLQNWLIDGIYPILSVNLFPLEARWAAHAVVVETVSDDRVTYLDPLVGRRSVTKPPFAQAWHMRRSKALLITK